MGSRL